MFRLCVFVVLCALLEIVSFSTTVKCSVINSKDYNDNPSSSHRGFHNEKEKVPYQEDTLEMDDYPMIVPKRAALLLDRIMVALHHALEDDDKGARRIDEIYKNGRYYVSPKMDSSRNEKMRTKFVDVNNDELPVRVGTEMESRDLSNQNNHQDDTMGLQRRGHDDGGTKNGRVYWRCYFNAVTCF